MDGTSNTVHARTVLAIPSTLGAHGATTSPSEKERSRFSAHVRRTERVSSSSRFLMAWLPGVRPAGIVVSAATSPTHKARLHRVVAALVRTRWHGCTRKRDLKKREKVERESGRAMLVLGSGSLKGNLRSPRLNNNGRKWKMSFLFFFFAKNKVQAAR